MASGHFFNSCRTVPLRIRGSIPGVGVAHVQALTERITNSFEKNIVITSIKGYTLCAR